MSSPPDLTIATLRQAVDDFRRSQVRVFAHTDEADDIRDRVMADPDLPWLVSSVEPSPFVEAGTILVSRHDVQRVRYQTRLGVTPIYDQEHDRSDHPAGRSRPTATPRSTTD